MNAILDRLMEAKIVQLGFADKLGHRHFNEDAGRSPPTLLRFIGHEVIKLE